MKLKNKIIDKYFAYPILIDSIIVIIIWICSKYFNVIEFQLISKENQINILSNLIGTDVSLAGFILAALTIIVSFKANLKAKGLKDTDNALELIFSSKHYYRIVTVFKKALLEFVLCSIFLFIIWLSVDNISIWTINRVNVSGITITSFTIFRSIFILFMILSLEKHKREE